MHICLIAIKVKSGAIWQTIPMIKGPDGDSAYQVALNNGFEGTEAEWLESLSHGPKGDDGAPGTSYQFIFKRTDTAQAPEKPVSTTDAVPATWSAVPLGVTVDAKYEWVSVRIKNSNIWTEFSIPGLWAIYGFGDSLPEIYIQDIEGLQEALDALELGINDKISKDLLPEEDTLKLPGADAFGVTLPKFLPKATSTSLGAIKLGTTLLMNEDGVTNVKLKMRELDENLTADPADGSVIVWDKPLQKYKNTTLSLTGLYHPLRGTAELDLTAKTLSSINLLIPKVLPTVENNQVALFALENGYSLDNPGAGGVSTLDDLNDVALTNVADGHSLFKEGLNFVNKAAYTKAQIDALLLGLNGSYHPLGGSDLLDFRARLLRSKVLYLPTEDFVPPGAGVAIFAKENGYTLIDPETSITEFTDLVDIAALTWLEGQALIYRNNAFINEAIYNKTQVDSLLANLNMSTYLTKVEALSKYHPKFGFENGNPLDFTADRLKSNTLLIPKVLPTLENTEVGIFAVENGYSLSDPQGSAGLLTELDDVLLDAPLNDQALTYSTSLQKWINKTLSFSMFGDSLSADLVSTTETKKFVSNAQILSWNAKWNYNEETIKAVKVNLAADSEKLGGILAGEYWHTGNSNLDTVDWRAKVLRSKVLVVPKELPTGLSNNEIAIYALETGYSLSEPGGGSTVQVLNDLLDVINTAPQPDDILFYDTTATAYINGPMTFNKVTGMLDPSRITTGSTARFVTDAQIGFWNAKEDVSNRNQANGYLGLNANTKIDFWFLPDVILGQAKFGGTFNATGIIASDNADLNGLNLNALTPALYTGYFFIAQADTTVVSIEVQTGDWIISNGAAGWAKVDNTDAVTSVNGRIGAIVLSKSDVGLSNVDNTADANKNVLSATKLFTPRTLWGQSFDGTANISGDLSNVGHITGNGILSMGAVLIPKTMYSPIPNNAVAIVALENGYSIFDPEAGTVASLNDLTDITLVPRVDKQVLYYNGGLGEFTNGMLDFSFIQGYLTGDRITQSPDYRFVTDAQKTNFQTAYNDRMKWDGGSSGLNAATGRESLELGSASLKDALYFQEKSAIVASSAFTGFANPLDIVVSYDHTTRRVTLIGDLKYFWKGTEYSLSSPWTSAAHTATEGSWYLSSIDGTTFQWSQTQWEFSHIMVAHVRYSATPTLTVAVREVHGIMDWNAHQILHNQIGTHRISGGTPKAGTFVENTQTNAAITPGFNQAVIRDEDCDTIIPELVEGSYTLLSVGAGETSTFTLGAAYPFTTGTSFIRWNNITTGTFVEGSTQKFYNVYQILLPAAADTNSQAYRTLFLQPQREFDSLQSAQSEDIRTLSVGGLSYLSPEFVFFTRITYSANASYSTQGRVVIATGGVSYVVGSRASQSYISGFSSNTHNALSNLSWTQSGHYGSANILAGFNASGLASEYSISSSKGTSDTAFVTQRGLYDNYLALSDAYNKTELNNFFGGSVAISGYNKSNWDTAYGWGNHALAGYATATSLSNHINDTSPHLSTDERAYFNKLKTYLKIAADNTSMYSTINFYSESGVSAYGIGTGGGGGAGVDIIDNLLSVRADAALSANQGRILKGYIDLKQPQLNGTGFVKANGTSILYDNNSYALASHTHTFASLTDKPTTINGYGITDSNYHYAAVGEMNGMSYFGTFASAVYANNIVTDSLYMSGLQVLIDGNPEYKHQLGFTYLGKLYKRSQIGGNWGGWLEVLDSSNYTSYAATASHNHNGTYALLAGSSSQPFSASSVTTAGNITIPNAYWYAANLSSGVGCAILGITAANKVSIDPNGYGAVFGSTIAMNGALSGATTGSFSGNVSAASFTSGGNAVLHAGNFTSYADSAGAASTVQGNLNTHAGLTTTAHGLGASAFHADSFFIQNQNTVAQTGSLWITGGVTTNGQLIGNSLILKGTSFEFHNNSDDYLRWAIGKYDAESGGNAGSNLYFYSYADDGSYLNNPLILNRITGYATFASTVQASNILLTTGIIQGIDNGVFGGNVAFRIQGITSGAYSTRISLQPFQYNGSSYDYREALSLNADLSATFSSTVSATGFTASGYTVYHTGNLTNTLSSGYLPYWNGSSLVNSVVYTNGTNIAIGLNNAYARLTLKGGIGDGFRMTFASSISAAASLMLDASENPYWSMVRASDGVETISLKSSGYSFLLGGNIGIGYTDRSEKFAVNGSGYFNGPIVSSSYGHFNNVFVLDGTTDAQEFMYKRNGQLRWDIISYEPEIGSNTGSNYHIYRYGDNGSYLDIALSINRANGNMAIAANANHHNYRLYVNGAGYFNGNLSNLGHLFVKGVGNYIRFDTLGVENSTYMGTVNNYDFRIANTRGSGCVLELNNNGYVDIIGELYLRAENQWRYFGNPAPSGGIRMGAGNASGTWVNAFDFTVAGNWVRSYLPFQAIDLITAGYGIQITGGISGQGMLNKHAVSGLQMRGIVGSSYDFELMASSGATVFTVPTGTAAAVFESYIKATSVKIGANWEAIPNGNDLELRYGGVMKAKLSSSGDILAVGGVTAFAV